MSYCRWSSDNFRCDLYVYEHVDETWTIHVAGMRHPEPIPEVPPFPQTNDPEAIEKWKAAQRAQSEWLDAHEPEPIGLPYDGVTLKLPSPGECADECERLQALGYHVPAYAITALRAEQIEMDQGDATERAYRRSNALEKRRALMQDWADFLDG